MELEHTQAYLIYHKNDLLILDDVFGSSVQTLFSNDANIESEISDADVVIGSVYVHGASAPKLVKSHLKK